MRATALLTPTFILLAGFVVGTAAFPPGAQPAPGQTCGAADIFDADGRLLADRPMRVAAPAGWR